MQIKSRVVTEAEDHAGAGNDRSTDFTFQGLTNLVVQETQTGGLRRDRSLRASDR